MTLIDESEKKKQKTLNLTKDILLMIRNSCEACQILFILEIMVTGFEHL